MLITMMFATKFTFIYMWLKCASYFLQWEIFNLTLICFTSRQIVCFFSLFAVEWKSNREKVLTLKIVLPSPRIIDITANIGMQPSEAAVKPHPIPCAHAGYL